ncbi:universal stress protein [Neptunomonas phycophila]|uniref:Universal stress protein n=1 Tax=Neptunomonas phycophila TaxID=1572645 RepID=A0AAW7XE88_9GAMM|nr:universal stress protein [Neptunomonas phycophila]MDO6452440.1 universal stress protein [Neptunomonas phycophila]
MNKIITCLDGSAFSNAVCSAGIWAANKLSKTLLLLYAIEKENVAAAEDLSGAIGLGARSSLLKEMAALDEQRSKVALEMGKDMLANAQTIAEQQGCAQIEQTQRHSDIVEAICDLESDARLIVIGRSGQGNKPDFNAIGSHIEQVIRQVHTPVLIANKDFSAPKSFMLAYDGRETADKAVKRIIEGGLLHGMTCHLVTVKNKQSGLMEKFKATEKMLRDSGFDVKASFLEDAIFAGLMDYKTNNEVDMLVMGAFSHSKLAQAFLGSNTLKMIENTHLPMLILR